MKQRLLLAVWLLIPALFAAFHNGPGRRVVSVNRAIDLLHRADDALARDSWDEALATYTAAGSEAPVQAHDLRLRARLGAARVRLAAGQLPEGLGGLESASEDAAATGVDPALREEIRVELATAHYHAAWLLRLDGAADAEWRVEADRARQQFRRLAEESLANASAARAEDHARNLEAVVRLERRTLEELRSMPPPCNGSGEGARRLRQQRSVQNSQGGSPAPRDARGASRGMRPDGSGS